jgi:hypothetical protein
MKRINIDINNSFNIHNDKLGDITMNVDNTNEHIRSANKKIKKLI